MILIYSSTTGTGELGVLFFLSLIINYYLDLNYVLESRSLLLIQVLLMDVRCSFICFTVFLVIFALAILIFIVIILTLARSNNFVCIFLYLQRASLVGFFYLPFLILLFFFDLVFLSFLFCLFSSCFYFFSWFFPFFILSFLFLLFSFSVSYFSLFHLSLF